MSTKQNLIAAKQLIIDSGWGQGEYRSPRGCYCALGAVREIIRPDSWIGMVEPPEIIALIEAVKMTDDFMSGGFFGVIDWNDAEGRTKEDVLELFDEAIRIADE